MPGLDDAEIELTLRKYHARNLDDDSVTEGWEIDAAGVDASPAGETPEEALRVLAASLEDDDGAVDIDTLADAEREDDVDDFEEMVEAETDGGDNWEVTD